MKKNKVSLASYRLALSATTLLIAVCLMSLTVASDSATGKLVYKGKKKMFDLNLKHAYFVVGPDAFDEKKTIRRLIFTEVDIEAKIKSCTVMNCADPLIEGIQVDLDAAPRILYWVNLDNQMVQYSGTSTLEALSLTTESSTRLAGKLHIHDSAAGGPTLDVTFDTPILKTFTKHR